MLIVETIGRIRREHLGKGKSIKEISRTLHLSRNTVRRILRSGETAFSWSLEPHRDKRADHANAPGKAAEPYESRRLQPQAATSTLASTSACRRQDES